MAVAIVERAAITDVGRQRTTNEDAYLDDAPVFAVADGMGGARAGEVASRIAVESFADAREEGASPEAQLAKVAQAANRRIYELAKEDESRAGMGTTLSAVMVTDGEVAIGHVGDSRVYRFREDELERLTHDHSLVEEFVRQGKLTPEEAETHPQRSIITRALGPEPDVEVETLTYPARPGDVYLICSDGLSGMLSERRIAEILRSSSSLERAAGALVREANEEGGRDNITVVLFRLGHAGEPAADTPDHPTLTGSEDLRVRPEREPRRPPAPPRRPAERRRGSRPRRIAAAVLALVAVAAIVVGFSVGSRQFYFVGTDEHGLVTLYRGLPYALPLGVDLFEEEYATSVPANAVVRLGRRCVLTDHELGSRGDRVDLIRQLEAGRLERGTGEC